MGLLSKLTGAQKEHEATLWLKRHGFQILEKNYRCKQGEIDLIGFSSEHELIFFEVKHRKSSDFGQAIEMITHHQQKRIIQCANQFLNQNPTYHEVAIRFDALIYQSEAPEPEWIQDAFQIT